MALMTGIRARARGFALNIAAIVAGLLLCEAFLSGLAMSIPLVAFHLQRPEHRLNIDGNEMVVPREIVPDAVLAYRLSPYSGRFDRWGYRNPDVPDRSDVLALGDSMTFGHDVAAEQSWPHVLSRLGGLHVYNAGVGGYGPVEYGVVLEETLRLRPRLVVVGLFIGNDMHDAFRSTYLRAGGPFKNLQHADPAVVAEMRQLEAAESLSARTLRLLGAPAAPERPAGDEHRGLRQWIADHSTLYSLAREVKRTLHAAGKASAERHGERNLETFESSTRKPQRFGWAGDPRLRTVFVQPEIVHLSMDLSDPRIREGLRITIAALVAMHRHLVRDGVEFIVLLIPTKESAYSPLLNPERDGLPAFLFDVVGSEARLRQEIVDALRASGISFVDALPALKAALAAGVPTYHQSDDGHPNAAGQAAIAKALVPAVRRALDRNR